MRVNTWIAYKQKIVGNSMGWYTLLFHLFTNINCICEFHVPRQNLYGLCIWYSFTNARIFRVEVGSKQSVHHSYRVFHYSDVIMRTMASPSFTQLLFQTQMKGKPKLRITGLCAGNSPVTGEFPAQKACNAENISFWWRHHARTTQLLWPLMVIRMGPR